MSVAPITPHLSHLRVPRFLRETQGWLMWRFEDNPRGKKPRKVPYYVNGSRRHGVQGTPEDRAKLASFDAAVAMAARRGMDGVGWAPMPEWRITALDFDDVLVDGRLRDGVLALMGDETYAEWSPSGRGVRAFVRGNLGNGKENKADIQMELFSSRGYVTVTGNILEHVEAFDHHHTLGEPTQALLARIAAREREPIEPTTPQAPAGVEEELIRDALAVLPSDLDYDTWVQVGMAIEHEMGDAGFEVWDTWSSQSSKYSTSEYGEERWRSFGRNPGTPVTIRTLIHLANQHGARLSLTAPSGDDEFEDLTAGNPEIGGEPENSETANKFPVYSLVDLLARPPPEWWIEGVFPQAQLGVIYGESGSGKTFVALDIALALSRGEAWQGLATQKARVCVVAAEGSTGIGTRLLAYARHHGLAPEAVGIGVVVTAPNLLDVADTKALIHSLRAVGRFDLLILDTLAQVMPGGNENSGEDMGKVLLHCREITRTTGAMVLLVHHSGKDAARGARGWSGLRAACDVEMEVLRDNDRRQLHLSKLKDGEDGKRWAFRLDKIDLDEKRSSCVVAYEEASQTVLAETASSRGKRDGVVKRAVLRAYETLRVLFDQGVERQALIAEAAEALPRPDATVRDRRPYQVARALDALIADDVFEVDGTLVNLIER